MRRKNFLIAILVIFLFGSLYYYYLNNDYKKIDIYPAKGFNKGTTAPIISITNKLTLMEFSAIIKTSCRIKGTLNVSYPNYVLVIYSYKNPIKTIYLWIDKRFTKGMYMFNTNTGYSIPRIDTLLLQRLLKI